MEIGDKQDHLACEVFIFSYFNSTYLGPFIVVLDRMKYTQHDLAPHIIWLSGCFIVATTYVLSKCLPNGEVHTASWCIHKKTTQRESNGDDVWQRPVSFCSSLVSGVAFGTSVKSSLTRLERKPKIA